ncbi:MAG: hypothetical protein ACO1TE_19470 [Prosthecobacter sp.]
MQHHPASPLAMALRLILCLFLALLGACTQQGRQRALAGPRLEVSYDDLGTEAMLQRTLGPRGAAPGILIHHGGTNPETTPRQLNAHQALRMLRGNDRALPHTPANEPLRQRMRAAYSRIYNLYRTRRDAIQAVPPFFGRGAMGRMQMLPPMPPSL